jgi:citrate lyase synthetase
VKDTVVLTPAKITLIIKISCAPIPVYFVQEENGVINVHPAVTRALFEHLVK